MTDLEITGPALRLVYRFLGDGTLTDAEKIAFVGALLGLVGDSQAGTAAQLQAAIEATGIVPARLGDWGPEDDRLAVHSQIADIIDTMPIEQLERVLAAAKEAWDV